MTNQKITTLTQKQIDSIKARIAATPDIPAGKGTREAACSMASINLALTGELTDEIPECMSEVIGDWIILIQDSMPSEMRNSPRWRSLLPLAAGTGRRHEKERCDMILAWMWETVLPTVQPVADKHGFGDEWRKMCAKKTPSAANAANYAANYAANAATAAKAATAANAASYAADYAANYAANAASYAADAANENYWQTVDPCGLLEKLINVSEAA